jgi:predicted unusual protein kinase regulating ubiquinone biosynthesis (AarF/ABC1/UbiB family)
MNDSISQFLRSGKILSQFGFEGAKFALARTFGKEDVNGSLMNLKDILGNSKGPIMKIAQILGTIPDLLPEDQAQIFRELQTSAPPMGASFVKRRMKGELGAHWESLFESFDYVSCFAASLGQVHKAVTLDGQNVACKLQYPDMQNAVEADLNQLKLLFKGFHAFNQGLDTSAIVAEIGDRLREEVDYLFESQMLKTFGEIFKDSPHIHIPKPIAHLTTPRLLTMTWLKGESVLWAQEQELDLRAKIADNLFYAWYYPFYTQGFIHADPHFGNYSMTHEGDINIFDFGCVRKFERNFIESVLMLFEGLLKKDDKICLNAYEKWGFEGLSLEIVPTLNLWANLLYGPLLEDKIRPLQENHSGVSGKETLFQVLSDLKKSGKLKIPREFIFLDRATVGIGSALLRLKIEKNWHQGFLDLLSKTGWKINI